MVFGEGEQTSSISISWELGRTAKFSALCLRNFRGGTQHLAFTSPPGVWCVQVGGPLLQTLQWNCCFRGRCGNHLCSRRATAQRVGLKNCRQVGDFTQVPGDTEPGQESPKPTRLKFSYRSQSCWVALCIGSTAVLLDLHLWLHLDSDLVGLGWGLPSFYTMDLAWIARVYSLNQWFSKVLVSCPLYM